MAGIFTIATVSIQTGIAKEVLRKWEARYGFPVPIRDESGNRTYTAEQVSRLALIKKLVDDGFRPKDVVPLDEAGLAELRASRQPARETTAAQPACDQLIGWLQSRDPALLTQRLRDELQRHGLVRFVQEVMPGMNELVGTAWESGHIAVRDEHLYSETVQRLLRELCAPIANPDGRPRMLLTTPPDEAHALGILMLETIMSVEGAYCISLGPQSPLTEIAMAATEFGVDIVGLSFSASFPKRKIPALLKEVRALLPDNIALWAGGSGISGIERTPRGVTMLTTLPDAVQALQEHRVRIRDTSRKA